MSAITTSYPSRGTGSPSAPPSSLRPTPASCAGIERRTASPLGRPALCRAGRARLLVQGDPDQARLRDLPGRRRDAARAQDALLGAGLRGYGVGGRPQRLRSALLARRLDAARAPGLHRLLPRESPRFPRAPVRDRRVRAARAVPLSDDRRAALGVLAE